MYLPRYIFVDRKPNHWENLDILLKSSSFVQFWIEIKLVAFWPGLSIRRQVSNFVIFIQAYKLICLTNWLRSRETKLCTQRKDSPYSFRCLDVSFDDIVS